MFVNKYSDDVILKEKLFIDLNILKYRNSTLCILTTDHTSKDRKLLTHTCHNPDPKPPIPPSSIISHRIISTKAMAVCLPKVKHLLQSIRGRTCLGQKFRWLAATFHSWATWWLTIRISFPTILYFCLAMSKKTSIFWNKRSRRRRVKLKTTSLFSERKSIISWKTSKFQCRQNLT